MFVIYLLHWALYQNSPDYGLRYVEASLLALLTPRIWLANQFGYAASVPVALSQKPEKQKPPKKPKRNVAIHKFTNKLRFWKNLVQKFIQLLNQSCIVMYRLCQCFTVGFLRDDFNFTHALKLFFDSFIL